MTNRRQFLITASSFAALWAAGPAFAGNSRVGTFTGKSNHVTTGKAKLVTNNGKTTVELQSDFTLDGAPDPRVALGSNGYDRSKVLDKLRSNIGAQSYAVPASMDLDGVNEVWIWCEKFDVPLGVAKLR